MRTEAEKRAQLKYRKSAKGLAVIYGVQRRWRERNRERFNDYWREYRKRNRLKVALYDRKNSGRREAAKRAATIGDLTEIAKVYERRQWWAQWFDVVVDHIIPLSCNGTHEAKNLQIIYRSENAKKRSRLDYKPQIIFV